MAQKTPLTALTIDYADRWNGTWFAELSVFSYKLIEDYYLRFLITYFLRIKKQWLSLLSLNHSGGFLFFQIMTCYAHATVKSKPMLFPTQQGKVYLKDWQQQLENKVNKLTICQNLNSDIWQKRLPVKKQNMWNYLHNTLLVQNTYNLAGTYFLPMRQHATLSTWFHNKQVKSTLTLLSEPIIHVLLTAQHNNNSLVCSIQQKFINEINSYKVMKAKMKYLQNVDWLIFLPMVYNSKKKYYSLYPVNNVFIQKRLFSQESRVFVKLNNNYSSQIYSAQVNVQLKEFEVSRQQQLSLKKASVSSYKKKELTAHYFSKKTALYQTIYQSKSYLMRRIFAFKWYSSIKEGFHVFFKRFRFQFALKKTLIMLNTPLIFLAQALKRVTGLRQFFSYLPMNWSYYDYKPVKRYTIFERYGSKKYFVPTFVASHLTMSRGSPTVLVDLLVHKLRHEYQHTQFLSCVEKICRHLMAPPKSNTAYENVICKGLEILFTGKVNGSDRSKQWRFKLGPVHSSTFYTNTREEHANIITKFGAFSLRIRMKLGSVGVRYFGNDFGFTYILDKIFTNGMSIDLSVLYLFCNVAFVLTLDVWSTLLYHVIYFKYFSLPTLPTDLNMFPSGQGKKESGAVPPKPNSSWYPSWLPTLPTPSSMVANAIKEQMKPNSELQEGIPFMVKKTYEAAVSLGASAVEEKANNIHKDVYGNKPVIAVCIVGATAAYVGKDEIKGVMKKAMEQLPNVPPGVKRVAVPAIVCGGLLAGLFNVPKPKD